MYKYSGNRTTSKLTIILISIVVSALVSGATTFFVCDYYFNQRVSQLQTVKAKSVDSSIGFTSVAQIAETVMPSVVGITSVIEMSDIFSNSYDSEAVGTGVIVTNDGYILTNSHVIESGNAKEVSVILHDGRTVTADVEWYDSNLDLAVIRVYATNLIPALFGNSDEIRIGELAVAIGNPLGLELDKSVTSGIISGLDRTIDLDNFTYIGDLIQTDASINPGNSGGPLINSKGQVIGINTVKVQTGEGLGFAIPINSAKRILQEIIETGGFNKVEMGINGVPIQQYLSYYSDADFGTESGILILNVLKDSSAYDVGIKRMDVITEINNVPVTNFHNLLTELYKYRPGDIVSVKLYREGGILELSLMFK